MPHHWWTPRTLILAAAAVALACAIGFGGIGLSYPEPVASAALGPDWQCSRLAFLFTTCSRVKNSQADARPSGQNAGVRAAADVIESRCNGPGQNWSFRCNNCLVLS